MGPRLIVKQLQGNKFELFDPLLNTLETVHSDRLKGTNVKPNVDLAATAKLCDATRLDMASSQTIPKHTYNLRSLK